MLGSAMVPGIGTWWECWGGVDNVDKDRVVNGKVRFRVCSNDRQSKVWYTFGWRHN